jgi:hypothetical protein
MFQRILTLLCLCLFAGAALAQTNPRAEFDAKALSAQEKRVLQAALTFENHYNSLLDGAWGRGSQSALSNMTRKRHNSSRVTWAHIAELANRWDAERAAREWRMINSQGISFQAPMKIMQPQRSRRGEALVSAPKGLQIRIMPQTISEALTLANAVTSRHVGRDKAYQSLSDNRLIVSATLDGGGGIYMRTTEARDGLVTALVEWNNEHAARARVMIASIQKGEQGMLTLPRGGTLAALTRPAPKTTGSDFTFDNDSTATADTTFRPIRKGRGKITGNAFFVNHTDLITAASVVKGCRAIELAGMGPARVVILDAKQGLALIMSQARSDTWVDIPRLSLESGNDVVVLGYSSNRADNQDLRAFRSRVREATSGPGLNGKAYLWASAPNARHGSMLLLDRARTLAGIVIKPEDGQNDNRFLASPAYLRGFLNNNNVFFDRGGTDGAAPLTENAVRKIMRPVLCER